MPKVEHKRLPDFVPAVSFDTELGERIKHIDFDYDAYVGILQSNELTQEEIVGTSIHFSAQGLRFEGAYWAGVGKVKVRIPRSLSANKTNKYLAHETRHRIDDVHGNLDGSQAKLNRAYQFLSMGGLILVASSLPTTVAAEIGNIDELDGMGPALWLAGAVMFSAGVLIYFQGLKSEKAARQAEKSALNIVSITH